MNGVLPVTTLYFFQKLISVYQPPKRPYPDFEIVGVSFEGSFSLWVSLMWVFLMWVSLMWVSLMWVSLMWVSLIEYP